MNDLRFVSKELKWLLIWVFGTLVVTCIVPFVVDPRWWYRPGNGDYLMVLNAARWVAIIAVFVMSRMIENQIKMGKKAEAKQRETEAAPTTQL